LGEDGMWREVIDSRYGSRRDKDVKLAEGR